MSFSTSGCLSEVRRIEVCAPPVQVYDLFPSARDLSLTWHSVVKIGQSLYREAPGMDVFRPDQRTPVGNFYLAGSYTKQARLSNAHI